jgi:hypothetical protein
MRLKKRIVRTLVEEIIVDVNVEAARIEAVIHWQGGVHTELHVRRRRRGEHGKSTSTDTVDAVRVLSRVCSDTSIAQLLNRNKRVTGKGNPWTRVRVTSLRTRNEIPVHSKATQQAEGWMTLTQAAAHVGVSPKTLRLAVERGEVEALHPLPHGPWIFGRNALSAASVVERFSQIKRRRRDPAGPSSLSLNLTTPTT